MTAYTYVNQVTGDDTIDVGSAPGGQSFSQFGVTISGPRGPWSDVSKSFTVGLQYSQDGGSTWQTADINKNAGSGRTLIGGKYLTASNLQIVISGFPSGAPAHMARTFARLVPMVFIPIDGSVNAAPSDSAYDWAMMCFSYITGMTSMDEFGQGDASNAPSSTLEIPGNGTGSFLAGNQRVVIVASNQPSGFTLSDTKGNSYTNSGGAAWSGTACLTLYSPNNTADLTSSDIITVTPDNPIKMIAAAYQFPGAGAYQNNSPSVGSGFSANTPYPPGVGVDYVSFISSTTLLPNDPAGYTNVSKISGTGLFLTASWKKNAA